MNNGAFRSSSNFVCHSSGGSKNKVGFSDNYRFASQFSGNLHIFDYNFPMFKVKYINLVSFDSIWIALSNYTKNIHDRLICCQVMAEQPPFMAKLLLLAITWL